MAKINSKKLEKAFEGEQAPQMTQEQEVAFHQGCLNTLINERNELVKMVTNVEAIMQAHLKRLEGLGVKIQKK